MKIENVTLSFGTQVIFDDINFSLPQNCKVGIVGVNGAGKSTLFNAILKRQDVDHGKISVKKNTRIAFLPQVISDEIPSMDISVFDFLLTGRPIAKLEQELEELYASSSTETDELLLKAILNKISRVQEKLEYYDVYNCENILLKIIYGLNITSELLDMKLKDLSGGQKSKIVFARLLYSKPEIILLDEPTNHLDKESREFVINYLKNYKGMVLVISHDIEFLNMVTDYTLYLNKLTHKAELFHGNYQKYVKIKQEKDKSLEKLFEHQEKEKEKLEKIISKYIRGNEKKANIAKDRQKKLAKLEKEQVIIEKKQKVIHYNMAINQKEALIPLRVENLFFEYVKDRPIINNLSFEIFNGQKMLILGENGVGKSTLLKLIIRELTPNSGNIIKNDKTQIAYYAQEHELLDNTKNIIDNFFDGGLTIFKLRTILGAFLFNGNDIYKKVSVLSPGERSRVALAKVAIKGANMLLLDEPTNHLDPETQSIIAETFKSFQGSLLVVSHNINFVENLGIEKILLLPSGDIVYYDKKIVEHYALLEEKRNH